MIISENHVRIGFPNDQIEQEKVYVRTLKVAFNKA